jgi:kynurenine formamidase
VTRKASSRDVQEKMEPTPTRERAEAEAIFEEVKNWGRWGRDDERGTLNLITPEVVVAAAALVRAGAIVGCGSLDLERTPVNPAPAQRFMTLAPDTQVADYGICRDFLAFAPHGPGITHLDALCHVYYKDLMYNGRPASFVTSAGAQVNSITAVRDGIVTRGVLLDIPAYRGAEFVDPAEPIHVDELVRAEQHFGVVVQSGDALLVRVGRLARRAALGMDAEYLEGRRHLRLAGLDIDCLPWLKERGVALMVSDAGHDALPSPFGPEISPIHIGCLVFMGLYLLDNARLDDLANACRSHSRWSFLFNVSPLNIEACTGSPVNPTAVF